MQSPFPDRSDLDSLPRGDGQLNRVIANLSHTLERDNLVTQVIGDLRQN